MVFVASLSLIGIIFISVIDYCSFNMNFYKKEYAKLEVHKTIGISEVELTKVTNVLLDYIKDKNDSLDVEASISGVNRKVFNEKEILHMVDVKNLYKGIIDTRLVLIGLTFISLLIYKVINKKINFESIYNIFKNTFISIILFIGSLGIYAYTSFDEFWLNFHYLFFTNDLFLLDPSKDILIQMVPSEFFMSLVFNIIIYFIVSITICFIILKRLGKIRYD